MKDGIIDKPRLSEQTATKRPPLYKGILLNDDTRRASSSSGCSRPSSA